MSIKQIYSKKEQFLEYAIKNMDYMENPLIINKEIYNEFKRVNKLLTSLNKYIYKFYFEELVDYLEIKEKRLKKFILRSYNSTYFEEINFINRWDFFITDNWITIAEINNDTPWWYIETVLLNSNIPQNYFNPNKSFYNNFIKEILKSNPKYIYITGSLAQVEDYRMMDFITKMLKSKRIDSGIWYLENLNIRKNGLYHNSKKVDIIFKYYPIDELYKAYNMDEIEKFTEKKSIKLLNHPISYIFQLKSYFSFLWKIKNTLPDWAKNTIESHIPFSLRMDDPEVSNNLENIYNEKEKWVLKDINNREGNNIFLWKDTDILIWKKYINANMGNTYWILQKMFEVIPIHWYNINFGIYNIWQKFSWIFTRVNDINKKTNIKSFIVWIWVKE